MTPVLLVLSLIALSRSLIFAQELTDGKRMYQAIVPDAMAYPERAMGRLPRLCR
jgi:hypothetical protein